MSQLPPMQSGPTSNPYSSPQFGGGGGGAPPTIKNWLVESIISLLCCGGLFAIPAIVYASQVNAKVAAGDIQGAMEASANAKKWIFIGIGINMVCGILIFVAQIILGVAVSQQNGGLAP